VQMPQLRRQAFRTSPFVAHCESVSCVQTVAGKSPLQSPSSEHGGDPGGEGGDGGDGGEGGGAGGEGGEGGRGGNSGVGGNGGNGGNGGGEGGGEGDGTEQMPQLWRHARCTSGLSSHCADGVLLHFAAKYTTLPSLSKAPSSMQ
jgi:hypothetical protein